MIGIGRDLLVDCVAHLECLSVVRGDDEGLAWTGIHGNLKH